MSVKIYKEYSLGEFQEFLEENLDQDIIDFIEENELWESVYLDWESNNNVYWGEDKIIDDTNDLEYLKGLLEND